MGGGDRTLADVFTNVPYGSRMGKEGGRIDLEAEKIRTEKKLRYPGLGQPGNFTCNGTEGLRRKVCFLAS